MERINPSDTPPLTTNQEPVLRQQRQILGLHYMQIILPSARVKGSVIREKSLFLWNLYTLPYIINHRVCVCVLIHEFSLIFC